MNRFSYVLDISTSPQLCTLPELTRAIADAVEQVTAEGVDPANDPAVLLLGAYIAFHTHADVNSYGGYRRLLEMCHDRLITEISLC